MKTKSIVQKLLVCLLAGLICGETFLRIGDRFLSEFLPIPFVIGFSVMLLAASLVYAGVWHWREKKGVINEVPTFNFWIGAIRYGIAFDLATFGLQKIFHLQFTAPLAMLDEPFSSFSSKWLMWSYFGHSYGFACLIGGSQIISSLLLVFNRTRLLGVITLIPVLLNIIFIDYFYELEFGVLLHALILLAGIIYLLLLDYDRLVDFFFKHNSAETSLGMRGMLKNVIRVSILIIPLLLILNYRSTDRGWLLKGKYEVTAMSVNNRPMLAQTCQDSLLTLVYLDLGNEVVFEFNNQKRRLFEHIALITRNKSIWRGTFHRQPRGNLLKER